MTTPRTAWLFSPAIDLSVFGGSALLALALLALGAPLGLLAADTPDWAWIPAILLIDVAHVWSTAFRVYLDPDERRRRPARYALVPLFGWLLGVALYSEGPLVFWRVLAYLAVFHFVRQQWGWVALYRARAGETRGAWLDGAAIYAATLWPLLHWHGHLPRGFAWFLPGDFAAVPAALATATFPLYVALLAAYAARAVWQGLRDGAWHPGKHLVVVTTALLWHLGIVTFNSDYAFTVTNVFAHGIPYLALVFAYGRARGLAPFRFGRAALPAFLGLLFLVAYAEEFLWDRVLWHERAWLFGGAWNAGTLELWLVPLLALPQLTHYLLDGLIWRRRDNPLVAGMFAR
ncbi:MAG: hypothetical protein EXR73_01705 [Myxococcales bacterium]|nr:hypothetical protein [Myxococcales bacterium]